MSRPVYERKSKLLFFEKMVNYDNSFIDQPVEKKKIKRKCRTGILKLNGHNKRNTTNQQNVCNPLKQTGSMMTELKNVSEIRKLLDGEKKIEGHSFDVPVLDYDKVMLCKQEQGGSNFDVTIFVYKCQLCQKGFATLCMLQEHIAQCAEVQKQRRLLEPNCIKCHICSNLKIFKSALTFRHHMKLFHTEFTEMDEVSKRVYVKCALCYTKRPFVYYSSLKMHLWRNHEINVDLKECSNYAIEQDQDIGSARTREYVRRIHKRKHVQSSFFHKQTQLNNKSSSLPTKSSNKFFVCRVCDKPFSESSTFLNHYRSHYSKSTVQTASKHSELQSEVSRVVSSTNPSNQDLHFGASCDNSLTSVKSYCLKTKNDISASDTLLTDSESKHLHLEMESYDNSIELITPIDSPDFVHSRIGVKVEPNEDPHFDNLRKGIKLEPDDVLDSKNSMTDINVEPAGVPYLYNSRIRDDIKPDHSSLVKHVRKIFKMEADDSTDTEDLRLSAEMHFESGNASDSDHSDISVGEEPYSVHCLETSQIQVNIESDVSPHFEDSTKNLKIKQDDASDSKQSRISFEIKLDDPPDEEHSRISVKVEGFEIELDQPSDYTANDSKQLRNSDTREHEFICKMCHKSFSNYVKLLCHSKIHEEQNPVKKKNHFKYSCPECKLTFSNAISYSLHIKTHGKESVCCVCGTLVESMDSLKDHLSLHKAPRQITEHTNNKCSQTKNYQKREKIIENPKCRICLICSKTFLTFSSYRQHMARHGIIKHHVNYAKTRWASARKHKHNDSLSENNLENNSMGNNTTDVKHTLSEQKNILHLVSSENAIKQNVCPFTEYNTKNVDAVGPYVEEDDNFRDVNSTVDQDSTKIHLYNTTGYSVPNEIIIFNAFSLSDERFANIDNQSLKGCEWGVKPKADAQPEQYVLPDGQTEQYVLPDGQHFTVEGFDLHGDNSTSRENGSQFNEVEGCAGGNSDCIDRGISLHNNGEHVGGKTKVILECLSETVKGIQTDMQVTNDHNFDDSRLMDENVKNVLPKLVPKVEPKDTSNLHCEICSKSMPTLAFKRIHMLLHRKAAQFKH